MSYGLLVILITHINEYKALTQALMALSRLRTCHKTQIGSVLAPFFQIRLWRQFQSLDTTAIFVTVVDQEKLRYELKRSVRD